MSLGEAISTNNRKTKVCLVREEATAERGICETEFHSAPSYLLIRHLSAHLNLICACHCIRDRNVLIFSFSPSLSLCPRLVTFFSARAQATFSVKERVERRLRFQVVNKSGRTRIKRAEYFSSECLRRACGILFNWWSTSRNQNGVSGSSFSFIQIHLRA